MFEFPDATEIYDQDPTCVTDVDGVIVTANLQGRQRTKHLYLGCESSYKIASAVRERFVALTGTAKLIGRVF